jgi:hypothetical protein
VCPDGGGAARGGHFHKIAFCTFAENAISAPKVAKVEKVITWLKSALVEHFPVLGISRYPKTTVFMRV